MHRLIVALLAAFDAAIAVAVGIAAILAPLTLVWVLGLGDTADWTALWPAGAAVWQFGHLAPLQVTLPGDYLAVTGIDEAAASFVLSLAPLAFATFTGVFAARSGVRASRADAWATGVGTGTLVVAALATLVSLTSQNPVAVAEVWQAILFPTLVYAVPALVAAVVAEWREAPDGVVARIRDRTEAWRGGWGDVVGVSARASAVAVTGLVGVGALLVAVALTARAGDIVALYQAANLDLLGATAVTLAQFAYLPTLVVWGMSFAAGPGFSLGAGSAVSPSGTQVGVVPGVPILGAIPESTSPWLLLIVLLPIGVGALAGWAARSRLLAAAGYVPQGRARRPEKRVDASPAAPPAVASTSVAQTGDARRSSLEGLLAASREPAAVEPAAEAPAVEPAAADAASPTARPAVHEPFLPRLAVTIGIAVAAAGAAALLAAFASGSAGPGRLSEMGPAPGPVALAVGLETAVGAGILLLSGRRGSGDRPLDVAPETAAPANAGDETVPTPPWMAPLPPPAESASPDPSAPASERSVPPASPERLAGTGGATAEPDAVTAPIELPPAPDTPPKRPSVD
ncbi:DUF6350 family protein [Microbacterium sp. BK668]|uniref:cell division protein PerM n=1 Tax=Microbacterium sp. BK668 TaxID=2512118 RepID=UPI00105D88E8|nr:DUF6350 family protein [Microbacterium sp. BK668]TDN87536.1 hypothetical protein EV279_3367 [Microbacterium sp. BK668]